MPISDVLAGLAQVAAPIGGSLLGGPAGAAIGASAAPMIGASVRGLGRYFGGPGEQEQARTQLLQRLQQQPTGPSFAPIAEQARQRFEQRTIPGIAERFAGTGGIGSSAFRQALGGAGADLESRLAALQSQHQLGQQQIGEGRLGALQSFLAQQQASQQGLQQAQQAPLGTIAPTILQQRQQDLAAQIAAGRERQAGLSPLQALLGQQQRQEQYPQEQVSRMLAQALGQQFTPIGHEPAAGTGEQVSRGAAATAELVAKLLPLLI